MDNAQRKKWLHDLKQAMNTMQETREHLRAPATDPELSAILQDALQTSIKNLTRLYEQLQDGAK